MSWSYHGPWQLLGDPHPGDLEHTSYRSQITSVFKVPGKKNLYIALADRWLTDLPGQMPDVSDLFDRLFRDTPTDEPRDEIARQINSLSSQNTSLADYVWLPVRFDGDMAYLDWKDEWRIEDYE